MRRVLLTIASVVLSASLFAQTGHTNALEFESVVHNFGKIAVDAGPQKCNFKYKNVSDKPVVINNVISSCGCSVAEWQKAPIMPGANGVIEVTYLNDQGPYPFDKTFTVYVSSSEKPIMLRITGIVFEKGKSLEELFPAKYGPLAMKTYIQNGGQIEQGLQRSESENIINLSDKKVRISFANVTPGLKISVKPATLEPEESAIISYTIDTKAATHWGKTRYSASILCNGAEQKQKFITETVIVTPYTSLSKEEIDNGPKVTLLKSSVEFPRTKVGEKITAQYTLKNTGKEKLKIYKIETSGTMKVTCPANVEAGESAKIDVIITPKKPNNYEVFTITLVTNSPERPLVNLYASGEIYE